MKTINRPSRLAFFKRWPGALLPLAYSLFVALDRAALRLLHAETQGPKDAPDLRLSKLDTVHALDERAHALERPKFGTEAVFGRVL